MLAQEDEISLFGTTTFTGSASVLVALLSRLVLVAGAERPTVMQSGAALTIASLAQLRFTSLQTEAGPASITLLPSSLMSTANDTESDALAVLELGQFAQLLCGGDQSGAAAATPGTGPAVIARVQILMQPSAQLVVPPLCNCSVSGDGCLPTCAHRSFPLLTVRTEQLSHCAWLAGWSAVPSAGLAQDSVPVPLRRAD